MLEKVINKGSSKGVHM